MSYEPEAYVTAGGDVICPDCYFSSLSEQQEKAVGKARQRLRKMMEKQNIDKEKMEHEIAVKIDQWQGRIERRIQRRVEQETSIVQDAHTLEEIEGEGVWCAWSTHEECLRGDAHEILPRTDEYHHLAQAWYYDIAGILVQWPETILDPEKQAKGIYPPWNNTGWNLHEVICIRCASRSVRWPELGFPRLSLERVRKGIAQAKALDQEHQGEQAYEPLAEKLLCSECGEDLVTVYEEIFKEQLSGHGAQYWQEDLPEGVVIW